MYYPQHSYVALICSSTEFPLWMYYILGLWRCLMYCLTCTVIIMFRKINFSWKYQHGKRCHSSGMWCHIDCNSVMRTSYIRHNSLQKRRMSVEPKNENTGVTVRHMEIRSMLNPASHEYSQIPTRECHVTSNRDIFIHSMTYHNTVTTEKQLNHHVNLTLACFRCGCNS